MGENHQLLVNKRRRLQVLQEKQALQGIDTPAHILLEIEDLKAEIKALTASVQAAEPGAFEVKPLHIRIPARKWATTTLTLTNTATDVYHHVELALQADWPISFRQRKFVVENLKRGVSQTVTCEVRVGGESHQNRFPLQLRVRADHYSPQLIPLQIHIYETSEAKQADIASGPSIKDFRKELRKLTSSQVRELCDEDAFQDLKDDIVDPMMSPARRTEVIIEFSTHRQLFGRLHELLQELLGPAYRFFNDRLE